MQQYTEVSIAGFSRKARQYTQIPAWLPEQSWELPGIAAKAIRALAEAAGKRAKSLRATTKPSQAWLRNAAVHALLRSNASSTLFRMAAYMSALGVMALIATHFVRSRPAAFEPVPAAPLAQWVNVAKPFPAFALPLSELAGSETDYALRRHALGARQDIMTWGSLTGTGPHLMVEIYRPATELTRFENAALEISARLQGTDAAMIQPAGEMETKFGPVSLVEFTLKPARQCLGFVRSYDDPRLQILGWQCVSGSASIDRNLAACAIDRLTLEAASEPKVRELFARAELKRNFCGERSHLMAPTPRFGPGASPPDPKRGR
jgi:hypothetical protein